jgi:hypothetical protein
MISSVATIASSLPPIAPGPAGALLTAVQCIQTITSLWIDPTTGTQYSKFSQNAGGNMIGSMSGMTIIYAPAFFTSVALNLLPVLSDLSFLPQQSLAGQFLIIHFLKRLLEVFFLHKYSGTVSQGLSTGIGIYYAILSAIIMFVADPTPKDLNANIGTGKKYYLEFLSFVSCYGILLILCYRIIHIDSSFLYWNYWKLLSPLHTCKSQNR